MRNRDNVLDIPTNASEFTAEQLYLLDTAEHLYVHDTNIEELPPLPGSLLTLYCTENKKLTSLPDFELTDITHIVCKDNNLSTLNLNEVDYLIVLDARNNDLKVFPQLPDEIKELYLAGNPFTKNITELTKYINYIKINQCINDLEDIIDIKSYISSTQLSKTGTIGNLPTEVSNLITRFFYTKKEDGGLNKTRKKAKNKKTKNKKIKDKKTAKNKKIKKM
mgnify:FL=1